MSSVVEIQVKSFRTWMFDLFCGTTQESFREFINRVKHVFEEAVKPCFVWHTH
ncbi:hypothetical protein SAMN05192588_0788 [Nonlabens sp. Hel1_33_55]|nr:hypothetical protein SAMN05192588_0788 [Nonlabens sp. Hel1_33_55]